MPISTPLSNPDELDAKLFLLLERDVPIMQEELKKTNEKISESSDKIDGLNSKISTLEERLNQHFHSDEKYQEKLLLLLDTEKKEQPFWRDFDKILILLFAIGFMILAGVKAYEGLAQKILPTVTITEGPTP